MGSIKNVGLNREKIFTVYCHSSPSGKLYFGITSQSMKQRFRNGFGYKDCTAFQKAIDKYGWRNIKHYEIACGLSKEEAEALEIALIAAFKTTDRKFGYNILPGGDSSGGLSDEGKRKVSEYHKGRKRPKTTGKKISDSLAENGHTKQVVCYETGEKFRSITDAAKSKNVNCSSLATVVGKPNRTCGGNHWVLANDVQSYNPVENQIERKKRKVYIDETGTTYDSVCDAAKALNISRAVIVNACKGRTKTASGFHVRYLEDSKKEFDYSWKCESFSKKVIALETGEIYRSIAEASRKTGIKAELISRTCNKKQETTHNIHFEFLDP